MLTGRSSWLLEKVQVVCIFLLFDVPHFDPNIPNIPNSLNRLHGPNGLDESDQAQAACGHANREFWGKYIRTEGKIGIARCLPG